MNDDRNPNLVAIFAQAETEFDDKAFAEDVMRMIDSQRRNTMLVWSVFVIAVLACFVFVASPVMTALGMATELLPTSIVSIESDWLQNLLAPINSIAAALALGIFVVLRFYRRVFG